MKTHSFRRACVCLVALCSLTITASDSSAATGKELYEAALFQDLPQVQALLAKGANPNHMENGRPILGWAAQNGNVQIVEALLKGGANPNIADEGLGHTPLIRAIETQQTETVIALLKANANPNAKASDGESCLMFAVESRKPKIVQALIYSKVDVKEIDKEGNSPVLKAAQDGMPESLEIIRILGKAGADMNASNIIYTPLVYAIEQGNKDFVKTLLETGADPNAKTQSGKLPIMAAFDNPEILQMLLASKADPNAVTGDGGTPLIEAIHNGNVEVVKTLLKSGADPKKVDSTNRTPLEIAESNYQTEIAELLKEKVGGSEQAVKRTIDGYEIIPADKGVPGCTIVDAAKKQMELHGMLQAQVDAGKMNSDIFRTFSEDTKEYGKLLTEDPPAACALLARLQKKYGL